MGLSHRNLISQFCNMNSKWSFYGAIHLQFFMDPTHQNCETREKEIAGIYLDSDERHEEASTRSTAEESSSLRHQDDARVMF